jgi:tRNA pseudouridine38-40 synthase
MPRYKLTIEYNGNGLVGWQRQTNGPSVQGNLENAVFCFSGEKITVFGAGRTDAGVHALGQVCHLDLKETYPSRVIQNAINAHLKPNAISVLKVQTTPPKFDARRDAISRTYEYRIVNRQAPLSLERGRAWWCPIPLNEAEMSRAAQQLIGEHDFTSFRSSRCQANSPIRTLDSLKIQRLGENIYITGKARSFLHKQMRAIVGTLKLVGDGRWTEKDVASLLKAKDRRRGAASAPPDGLYLTKVNY